MPSTPPLLREHLQGHREQAGLNRTGSAHHGGLSRHAICTIESGAIISSTLAALTLTRALRVTVMALATLALSTASAETVRIAAASDLKFVLDELITRYRAEHPNADPVLVSYGSSGNFYAQIANGAPFTLYLSADATYPTQLERAGFTVKGTRRNYAVGRLVIWVPKNSPLDVAKIGPQALNDPRVRRVAIANPEHAPYGAAAMTLLEHYKLSDTLKGKFVLGENISQAAQYAASAADAGILALSIVKAPTFEALGGSYWLAPVHTHTPLQQQMVIIKDGPNTRQFWGFVLSPPARDLFRQYGFILPRGQ